MRIAGQLADSNLQPIAETDGAVEVEIEYTIEANEWAGFDKIFNPRFVGNNIHTEDRPPSEPESIILLIGKTFVMRFPAKKHPDTLRERHR